MELQERFRTMVEEIGFLEATYRLKFEEDICRLEALDELVVGKKVYLYGAGKEGKIIKRLIDKYHKNWDLRGFVVTNKDADTVEQLPVLEYSQIALANETEDNSVHEQLILVSVSDKYRKEIVNILINYGLREGIDFV